jgi:hypothetical protein
MPGGFARRIEARHRPIAVEYFRPRIGSETAERVGDGANQGVGKIRRFRDGARPVRFRWMEPAASRDPVAAGGIEGCRIRRDGGIIAIDRLSQISAGDSDQFGQALDRIRAMRRKLRPDRPFEAIDVIQATVENRKGCAVRPHKMNIARKTLPGFVHEARALVEETLAVLVDHNAVGIDQHHRRGLAAAWIDRLDMHSIPVAGGSGPEFDGDADSVAAVQACSRRDQLQCLGARAEPVAHHRRIALKSAGGEDDGIRIKRLCRAIPILNLNAGDTATVGDKAGGRALIANRDACPPHGAR